MDPFRPPQRKMKIGHVSFDSERKSREMLFVKSKSRHWLRLKNIIYREPILFVNIRR